MTTRNAFPVSYLSWLIFKIVSESNLINSLNCLGRENITTVGQILEYTEDDLLNLTNFGQKSLDELVAKLDELGLSLPTSSDLNSDDNSDA